MSFARELSSQMQDDMRDAILEGAAARALALSTVCFTAAAILSRTCCDWLFVLLVETLPFVKAGCRD
jgi:hypothetical protein